ncbi:MAG: hypothetical protein K9L26_01990 [Candidatus Izimaplasma sp.]|nr:hypothetical protein [Candidatus Izimaplasma bacterium]
MFDFTLGGFTNFFFGMITGIFLFSATLVYLIVRGKNIDVSDITRPQVEVNDDDLKQLIIGRQKKLKRTLKLNRESIAKITFDISYELIEEIARYFFPNSKYPMLELSVHELITLNHYISDRINDILDKPILKNTKNIRVTNIMKMYDRKRMVEQSRAVKWTKKYKVGKVLKYGSMAVNVVNPVYWFRKLVINTSIDVITRKICVVIIGVVGEETVKIYSKKVFDEENQLGLVDDQVERYLQGDDDDDEEDYDA